MDMIAEIRRRHLVSKESMSSCSARRRKAGVLPHLKCSHVPECCLIRIAPQRCSRCCIGASGYGAHQYGDTG